MCRVLGVSTSGYYAWRQRSPSRRAQEREALSRRIAAIHVESRQTYGARRVQAELQAEGVSVSRQRVARLMRALGLEGVTRRKRRCTTRRDREAAVAPDRVQRRFEASEPNRLWVADITYVPTLEGFVYLATVLDVFSRKVVGWALGARQTVELVQAALEMALQTRAASGRGVPFRPREPVHGAGVQPALRRGRHRAFDGGGRELLRQGHGGEPVRDAGMRVAAARSVRDPRAGGNGDLRVSRRLLQSQAPSFGAGLSRSPVEFEQAWHGQQAAA